MKVVLSWGLVALGLVAMGSAQTHSTSHKRYPIGGSAPSGARLKVAGDLDARLAKWRRTPMPAHTEKLTSRERAMVEKLVLACKYLDDVYWSQSDPDGQVLYRQLQGSVSPRDQKILRLLKINGSRWDLLDQNQPFVGDEPAPPGRSLYPEGLKREQIEQYVKDHPESKGELYDERTVIRKQGDQLQALPYHMVFRSNLDQAARALREAAELSGDKAFAEYLRKRADALLNDNYFDSDVAWLELQNPKFDLIFAPYETYLDGVLGVKTSYGAAVLIRNDAESKRLSLYEKFVPEMQAALPLAPEDKPSKQGQRLPMEVVDSPFRTGDLGHGYQAVADNLPNDARIQAEKGTKKIFFKNFLDARVNSVILPMAKLVMDPEQAKQVNGEAYLATTLAHEISHGLGPAYARVNGKSVDIRESIGPKFSGLEEAKADVVGLLCLQWLMDQGHEPKENAASDYISHVADLFRSMRFGAGEAHSTGETMEFNYLSEQGAIRHLDSGRYGVDLAKMPAAIASLAKELLEIEATGDRDRAEKWFAKYSSFPPELTKALDSAKNVPVDIDPVFALANARK